MKKIETEFAKKMVNNKFYGKVDVTGEFDADGKYIPPLTQEDIKNENPGYILAPYTMEMHTEESLKDYKEFMAKYRKKHEVCPKCGERGHLTTLMSFIMYSDRRDEYKNLNACECSECGDRHTAHDRISIEDFEKLKA